MAKSSIPPTLEKERALASSIGGIYIAGLDEAGRGALAGPVYAAAVVLPLESETTTKALIRVRDSKQLTPITRRDLYTKIVEYSFEYGVGWATAAEIDSKGIVGATKLAMMRALSQLETGAEGLLVDGRLFLSQVNLPQEAIIRGDSVSLSIAAASILAKVSRDRFMTGLDLRFPEYGFARHKGYGTRQHMAAITNNGPCPVHRLSFSPFVQQLV